jgi:predicted kinase
VPATGSKLTKLIILRGNSASGKSTTAAEIRARYGRRDLAIVGQDHLRRVVLREHDIQGGANIALIDLVARFALDHGYHTIVEGIFHADHYADMLAALIADHQGMTRCYYFDIPFEETVRRHSTKPLAAKYGRAEMSKWYRERDLLADADERIIAADTTLGETVERIIADTGLAVAVMSAEPC